jgi:molybdenum cofactor cytidylyltransferase
MKFGDTPLGEALGAILAHSLKLGSRVLKKGSILTEADLAALGQAGLASVTAARLEPGDAGEDQAADALAQALAGGNIRAAKAFTGRANLFAEKPGLCLVDRDGVNMFNAVDEAITLATIEPASLVQAGQMVATVKIVPFAVPEARVKACLSTVGPGGNLLRVAPFQAKRVALIQTRLPGMKESVLDKTLEVTRARLSALGGSLLHEIRAGHRENDLAAAIKTSLQQGAELLLIAGASAILDRRDVIPAAIVACGGEIDQFGMPVDPGNLLLAAHVGGVPVLGLPGCARSPKENGFDWVLRLILAGRKADAAAIRRMGAGGLLEEIASRPLPRGQASADTAKSNPPRIAALVLAAGRSSRMGEVNKLLIGIDGKPMVRRVAETALAAGARPVIAVTGHESGKVEAALAGLSVTCVYNPDFARGLSTSLKRGLENMPRNIDGVLVCLGDMPLVSPVDIGRILAAFDPDAGREIIVPACAGKRGNPVLWSRRFFNEMQNLAGDAGAKHLIGAYPEAVAEVETGSEAVLTDIDTPQALASLSKTAKIGA